MTKVQILIPCEHCNGQAYLPDCEVEDHLGRKYQRYVPCPMCEGSGQRSKWVSLVDFANLFQQEQCRHLHTSFKGGMHFSAGDVWDDLTEVCNDCGANLDRQPLDEPIHDPQIVDIP